MILSSPTLGLWLGPCEPIACLVAVLDLCGRGGQSKPKTARATLCALRARWAKLNLKVVGAPGQEQACEDYRGGGNHGRSLGEK